MNNRSGGKKRKAEFQLDDDDAAARQRRIEQNLRELAQLENSIKSLDAKIHVQTHTPSIRLKTTPKTTHVNKKPKKTQNKKKQNSDNEAEFDGEDSVEFDRPIIPRLEENRGPFDEDILVSDEDDTEIPHALRIAANREKREMKPSLRYSADYLQRRAAQSKSIYRRAGRGSSHKKSSPTPKKLGPVKKPVLTKVPFWVPIKAKEENAFHSDEEVMSQCKKIVLDLLKQPDALIFAKPVVPSEWGCFDYYDVVKNPMDLGTIQRDIREKKIVNVEQFCKNVRLIWDNAMLYNGPTSNVGKIAIAFSALFENKVKELVESDGNVNLNLLDVTELTRKVEIFRRELQLLDKEFENLSSDNPIVQAVDLPANDTKFDLSPQLRKLDPHEVIPKIDYAERCQIYNAVSGLPSTFMRGLYDLVLEENDPSSRIIAHNCVEVDSDTASPRLLRRLQLYLEDCRAILSGKDSNSNQSTGIAQSNEIQKLDSSSEKSSSTSESESDNDDDDSDDDHRFKSISPLASAFDIVK
jgi:hypothetical protein